MNGLHDLLQRLIVTFILSCSVSDLFTIVCQPEMTSHRLGGVTPWILLGILIGTPRRTSGYMLNLLYLARFRFISNLQTENDVIPFSPLGGAASPSEDVDDFGY